MFIPSRTRSQELSGRAAAGLTRTYLVGCLLVLSSAIAIGYASQIDDIFGSASTGTSTPVVENHLKELLKAIHDALAKERHDIAPAMRSMQVSFDSLPKDSHGLVNARGACHLLHAFFARQGLKIEGLNYQGSRPTSTQGLHEALVSDGLFQHASPPMHEVLRRMADVQIGFSLKTIGGMAAVIKAKHLSKSHVSTMMKLLYRNHHLSMTQSVGPEILHNFSDQYITYVNDVNAFTKSVEPALADAALLESIKDRAIHHAHALKEREDGSSANSTSPKFSTRIVALMLENLTDAFSESYHLEHCSAMTKMLTRLAPKETGRLRLSSFYSQTWNATQNFQEPNRQLELAGALDKDSRSITTHLLIANYMQGPLNCIKQARPFSLCCPNRCITLLQSIEAAIRAPATTPEKILDVVSNLSWPTNEAPSTISQELIGKLNEISLKHGGMVPLHGRLFAQWMHYTFPNACAYPQEERPSAATPKTRLAAKDIAAKEREEVAWAKVTDRGFGISAKMLSSSQWSETEELPLQQAQTWHKETSFRQIGVRVAACTAMLGILLHMILTFFWCGDSSDKEIKVLSAQQHAFEQQVKAKLDALRFEFSVELSCGKHQEHLKVGMQLKPALDLVGGILVQDILPDGLMHLRNKTAAEGKRRQHVVKAGDRLMSVSGETEAAKMVAELSQVSTKKISLRFSRDCSQASPLMWTAEVSRNKGEPWGMSISEAADSQNSKELTVSRVLPAGPVDKWNKRAVRKNTYGIYPGDVIIACNPELDAKKILSMLQMEHVVTLTVLRWQAAQAFQTEGNATCAKGKLAASSVDEDSHNVGKTSTQLQVPPGTHTDQSTSGAPVGNPDSDKKEEVQTCSCCGAGIGDRFLVMTCLGGEVKHYRRTCWRHKHGGFTLSHMPRRGSCGKPVAKLEVYERSNPTAEARLVHTILDGPMEIDISLGEAAENQERGERPVGSRRAASVTRRSIEGDARRRAASAARRVKFDNAPPKGEQPIEVAKENTHVVDEVLAESSSEASTSRVTELSGSCKTDRDLAVDAAGNGEQGVQIPQELDQSGFVVSTESATRTSMSTTASASHTSACCAAAESDPKGISCEQALPEPTSCRIDACPKALTVVSHKSDEQSLAPPTLPLPIEEAPIRSIYMPSPPGLSIPQVSEACFGIGSCGFRPPPGLGAPCHEAVCDFAPRPGLPLAPPPGLPLAPPPGMPVAPPPGLPPTPMEGGCLGFSWPSSPPHQEEVEVRAVSGPLGLPWTQSNECASGDMVASGRSGRRWGRQHSEAMHLSHSEGFW